MAILRLDCVATLRQGSMSSRARSVSTDRPRARARRDLESAPELPRGKKKLRLAQSAEVVLGQRRARHGLVLIAPVCQRFRRIRGWGGAGRRRR